MHEEGKEVEPKNRIDIKKRWEAEERRGSKDRGSPGVVQILKALDANIWFMIEGCMKNL